MSQTINQVDARGGGVFVDVPGPNLVTAGGQAVTVTASLGVDTIVGGAGPLLVDAGENFSDVTILAGSGPLDFIPGSGANSVVGAAGAVTIEAGFQGFEGPLAYLGGTGPATVNGYIDTTVTGGTGSSGTVLFLQNGPSEVVAGAGTVTIYTDGNQLTITSADGRQSTSSFPDTHVYLQVTDGTNGLATVSVNGIDGTAGGGVTDQAGSNWVTLGAVPATVMAALGADTIQAGGGDVTVDATGNRQRIVVNAGSGSLHVVPGIGSMQIVGSTGAIHVAAGSASPGGGSWDWTGPPGDTVLLDHDRLGRIRLTDAGTGVIYTFSAGGGIATGDTVSGNNGSAVAAGLLAGEAGNVVYGGLQQRLGLVLGTTNLYVPYAPSQAVPQGAGVVPGLVIPSGTGGTFVVPSQVAIVTNRAAGASLQGNGQSNQFIISTSGFTYRANGGSGAVLADDVQAGDRAGNGHVILAPSGGGDFLIATGAGDDTIEASSGNTTIASGGGSNTVYLGSGRGVVHAAGIDTVISGSGAATVEAAAGVQTLVFGGPGRLSFIGGAGAATVIAGAGRPDLTGGAGDVVFWGSGDGFSTLRAGTGGSTLVGGGSGNVIYAGGARDELLVAGIGGSTVIGGSATGNNVYWGSFGDDLIVTDLGHDTVISGPGHDTVRAGSGTAIIFGGGDGNVFVAGPGAQDTEIIAGYGAANTFTFVNGQAGGHEVLWGFRPGTDRLSLQGYAAGELDRAVAGAYGYGFGTGITLSDGTTIGIGDLTGLTRDSLG